MFLRKKSLRPQKLGEATAILRVDEWSKETFISSSDKSSKKQSFFLGIFETLSFVRCPQNILQKRPSLAPFRLQSRFWFPPLSKKTFYISLASQVRFNRVCVQCIPPFLSPHRSTKKPAAAPFSLPFKATRAHIVPYTCVKVFFPRPCPR